MTPNEYQTAALTKQADQEVIRARVAALGPKATQLDNAARGIAEEAGECQAVVKRYLEYGRPLDRERGLDEAGDVLWRVGQYLDALGYTMQDAMEANLRKLGIRYQGGYTAEEAADENRDRAAEATAVASDYRQVRNEVFARQYGGTTGVEVGPSVAAVMKARAPGSGLLGCCTKYIELEPCDCLAKAVERDRRMARGDEFCRRVRAGLPPIDTDAQEQE